MELDRRICTKELATSDGWAKPPRPSVEEHGNRSRLSGTQPAKAAEQDGCADQYNDREQPNKRHELTFTTLGEPTFRPWRTTSPAIRHFVAYICALPIAEDAGFS
jgi:hypothetical protein